MGLIDDLKKHLEIGGGNGILPIAPMAPTPPPVNVSSPRMGPAPTPSPSYAPSSPVPTPAPQIHPNIFHRLTHNPVTNTVGSFVNGLTGIPSAVDAGRLGVAELTHNQPAIDSATSSLADNLPKVLPIAIANNFKNGFGQSIATAVTEPYAEHLANQEADRVRQVFDNNTADPIHNANVEAYASAVKGNMINEHLNTAGVDMSTPNNQVVKKVAGQAIQTGADVLTGASVGNLAKEQVVARSLAKEGLDKAAIDSALKEQSAGNVDKYLVDNTKRAIVSQGALQGTSGAAATMQNPNATPEDYVKSVGENFAYGAALPTAIKYAPAVLHAGAELPSTIRDTATHIKSVVDNFNTDVMPKIKANNKALMSDQTGAIGGSNATGFPDALNKGQVFDGVDGKPRFEINDSNASINKKYLSTAINGSGMDYRKIRYNTTVGDVLNHPELYKQYPELKDIKVGTMNDGPSVTGLLKGQYDPATKTIYLNKNLAPEEAKSTLLHELQHAIQSKEQFSGGGSLDSYPSEKDAALIRDNYYNRQPIIQEFKRTQDEILLNPKLTTADKKIAFDKNRKKFEKNKVFRDWLESNQSASRLRQVGGSRQYYDRLAGEAEARAVQKRMDMPMSERYVQPDTSYRSSHQINEGVPITSLTNLNALKDKVQSLDGYISNEALKDFKKLEKIVRNPDADVKIYRAAPKNELNPGDWVTTNKSYANDIKRQNGGKVYEYTVKAKDLSLPANIADNPSLARFAAFQYTKETQPRSTFYDSLDVPKKDLIIHNKDSKSMSLDKSNGWREAYDQINFGNDEEANANLLSQKQQILRSIATVSRSDKELNDVLDRAEALSNDGYLGENANIIYDVMQNPGASGVTKARATSLYKSIIHTQYKPDRTNTPTPQKVPGLLTPEEAKALAEHNGTTPLSEMATSILNYIDVKGMRQRIDGEKAAEQRAKDAATNPAPEPAPIEKPIDVNANAGNEVPAGAPVTSEHVTPHVTERQTQIVKEYADMLQSMDNSGSGGIVVPNGEGGYKRVTEHTPFYSRYFKEHGRAPSPNAYQEEAFNQLENGHADPIIQDEYAALKENPAYFESLFSSQPTGEAAPNAADQLTAEAQAAGAQPKPSSPETIARAVGIKPSRVGNPDELNMTPVGSIIPGAVDRVIANSTGQTAERIAAERYQRSLEQQKMRGAETAVRNFLHDQPLPHSKEILQQAAELYKGITNRKNGGDKEAARVVSRLSGDVKSIQASNPMAVDIPDVKPGDYRQARTQPQVVQSLIHNRTAQVLPAVNRLSHNDKMNFWKMVEDPALLKNADSPKAAGMAVQRWRDLADTVHAVNKSLGGKTKYVANYARHNWDLTNPEDLARFEELINSRRGKYHDPYNFGGVNRQARVFDSIAAGEAAGFKLKNPDNPTQDILDYSHAVITPLTKQALSKAFTEADATQSLKNRTFDLRNGETIPLSEKGLKEIQAYNPIGQANKAVQLYRKGNRGLKSTLLSLTLFHPVNINILQAFPTLIGRGRVPSAFVGLGRSGAALFNPRFSEKMHQTFLEDGKNFSDNVSTVEAAAKMGTPIRKGSDFEASGSFMLGKKGVLGAFERAIFDRSIAAMQGTMVQAAHRDLLARGKTLNDPEAISLGLEINKIMGFINKEVENRMRHGNTVSSDFLLAPQFTRSKWSVLKDAFTKGGLHGSYARRAVIGKYAMEATIAIAAGYMVQQKTDNIRDILLRQLVHPSIPTPFKDSKGNNIEVGMPHNFVSEVTSLGSDLSRNKNGRVTVTARPQDVKDNLQNYARSRLAVIPSAGLKYYTNTNFGSQPIRDTTASNKTQAVQSFTNLVNDVLPIGVQGLTDVPAIRNHLPADVKSGLKVSSSGGDPVVRSLISSIGFTPKTDKTTGQGLDNKNYFDALNEATRGMNRQEKDAFDLYTGSKKNPVTGEYQIQPTVYDTTAKAEVLLQNPRVIGALKDMNQKLQDSGKSVDPLWTSDTAHIIKYLQYETIDKNNTGQLTKWQEDNKSWYPEFASARSQYFDLLPPGDPNRPKLPIQPPQETPQLKQLFTQYGQISDSKERAKFLTDNPSLVKYFDDKSTYTNQLLSAQGLTPLKSYPKASPELQAYMTKYNASDKATRKAIRNNDPKAYQDMIGFYDSIDLYTIGKESAVNRLQGEPDSNSKENKAISSLARDIYQGPDGSYNIVPAGWMNGLTNGSGSSGYTSFKSKYGGRSSKYGYVRSTKSGLMKPTDVSLASIRSLLKGTTKPISTSTHVKVSKPRLAIAKKSTPHKGPVDAKQAAAELKRLFA